MIAQPQWTPPGGPSGAAGGERPLKGGAGKLVGAATTLPSTASDATGEDEASGLGLTLGADVGVALGLAVGGAVGVGVGLRPKSLSRVTNWKPRDR